jgi:hypothetical protein
MSVATLIGTPDPDHTTPLPSSHHCTCIFTATTAGPFGMNLRMDAAVDPDCPRHRTTRMPQKRDLLQRFAGVAAASLGSARLKLA